MSQRPSSAAPASASQVSRGSRRSSHRNTSSCLIGAGHAATMKKKNVVTSFGQARPGTVNVANPSRRLHDPEAFWNTKTEKSAQFFKGTRVQTCSHIVKKNGKSVAI